MPQCSFPLFPFHFQVGDNKVLHMSNTSTNPPRGRCSESKGLLCAPCSLFCSSGTVITPVQWHTGGTHCRKHVVCQFGTACFGEDSYVGGVPSHARSVCGGGEEEGGVATRPVPQEGGGHASAEALEEEGGTCGARPRPPRSFLRPHVIGRRLRGPEGGGQGEALVARCAELQQLRFARAHVPLGQALESLQAVLNSDSLQVVV